MQRSGAVISDVPDSVAHFPGLADFSLAGEVYTWKLEKAGMKKVSVQAVYAVRYSPDPEAHQISWAPVEGIGNTRVSGKWVLEGVGGGTRLTLHNDFAIKLDLPRVLRRFAEPLVIGKNTSTIEGYLENLKTTFNGGDGRLRKWEL